MSLPLRRIAAGAARRRLAPAQSRTLSTSHSSSASSSPLRTGLYAAGLLVSAGVLTVYYSDSRSAIHRYAVTPALRKIFDAETGHKIAVKALAYGLGPKDVVSDDERLSAQVYSFHQGFLITSDLPKTSYGGNTSRIQ
jgi:dihydroorotate dehydrogenase